MANGMSGRGHSDDEVAGTAMAVAKHMGGEDQPAKKRTAAQQTSESGSNSGKKAKRDKEANEVACAQYGLMKYAKHGKEGTYAVRTKRGAQWCEVNVKGASLELDHGAVVELLATLKETLAKRIEAEATS